uniref:7TM_GPCR_Srx domain-containing protein n=1 Tax=Syphacia muris TaxID=451379 RepID=A0A0N5AK74_9BILA
MRKAVNNAQFVEDGVIVFGQEKGGILQKLVNISALAFLMLFTRIIYVFIRFYGHRMSGFVRYLYRSYKFGFEDSSQGSSQFRDCRLPDACATSLL